MAAKFGHHTSTDLDTGLTPPDGWVEDRVRRMGIVRSIVAQLVGDQRGQGTSDLSDEEWEALLSAARGADSEELAVTRVVLKALRLTPQIGPARPPSPLPVAEDCAPALLAEPAYLPPPLLPIPLSFAVATELGRGGKVLPDRPPAAIPSVLPMRARRHARAPVRTLDAHRERWLTVSSWVRNIGAIILLFVGWQLWGTAIIQHHTQTALKQQFEAKVPHVVATWPRQFSLIPATTRIPDPPEGSGMANLDIPKIGLNQIVVSGTGTDDLAKGPGHYLGTALPGQAGNVAIAGHRTTHGAPFNQLAELAIGDPIYLTTLAGRRLTYIVSATPYPVAPTNVSVLNNFGDDRLTLTTCNPEYSARQRLIVVAAYLPPGTSHPAPIVKGTGKPYKLGAGAGGWDSALLPLVLALIGLLAALGWGFRRISAIYGRESRWLILIPVWGALLLALFETLTRFLPASV